ncbi:MAG: TolB-like 6-bladed beta-propeller domain-containing protein [Bacteroidales bacterium]|nr:TolB-like 6-bladed beta-propeller domain-containing protein [Bacteroidales bacterium]
MKYRLFFIQIICFLFLCSCSNNEQTDPMLILNHQTIDMSEHFIGIGGFLAFSQDNIVGIEYAPSMQPFFCLKQTESSQTLFHFGNKGRGPNEFLMPYSIQYLNNQTVGVWDMMSTTYYEFRIPNEHEGVAIDKAIKIQGRLSRIIKTSFNQYIGLSFDEGMFLLADSTGTPVNTFFEYPYQDNSERQLAIRSSAYQGTLAANPSKNKFVYSSYQGEIIHFYEIEHNNIKPIAKIENEYPSYKEVSDGGVAYNANGKRGYIATYATDNFVYAIFSGKTFLEQGITPNFEGKILRIFDWNGVLVKEYALDIPCSYLCVSDDDSTMWAIATTPDLDITLVLFELEKAVGKNQVGGTQGKQDVTGNLLNNEQWINEQLIKEQNFLKSFPDDVDVQRGDDGNLQFNYDTTKYTMKVVTADTVIDGRKLSKHRVVFEEIK